MKEFSIKSKHNPVSSVFILALEKNETEPRLFALTRQAQEGQERW